MTVRDRTRAVAVLTALLLPALAAPAFAHVTMEVRNPRPGATTTYTVSVPNESDSATTDLIELQLPEGLQVTGFKPGRGWAMRVEDAVLVIEGGQIRPGERREFRFTAVSPTQRGELVFPAIQTYSDGDEVRWVGEEGSDNPAAVVMLEGEPVSSPAPPPTPASEAPTPAPTAPPAQPSAAASPTSAAEDGEVPADSGLGPVPIVLLVLAALGVGLTLVARRRRPTS